MMHTLSRREASGAREKIINEINMSQNNHFIIITDNEYVNVGKISKKYIQIENSKKLKSFYHGIANKMVELNIHSFVQFVSLHFTINQMRKSWHCLI